MAASSPVGIGYTLQVVAQQHAIASHAAILFSLEAVFAALAGAFFLDESLALRGYFGAALMFIGMLIAQLWPRRQSGLISQLTGSMQRANAGGRHRQNRSAAGVWRSGNGW